MRPSLDWSEIPGNPTSKNMQAAIEKNRPVYEDAKKKLSGEDKQWTEELNKKMRLIYGMTHKPGEQPPAWYLGYTARVMEEIYEPMRIVTDFEAKLKLYKQLCEIEDAQKEGS